jgi:hypothetical protein
VQELPIEQQMRVAAGASILLMMHGAALGFWPFLPRRAVAIHVVPHPDSNSAQFWGHRMVSVWWGWREAEGGHELVGGEGSFWGGGGPSAGGTMVLCA